MRTWGLIFICCLLATTITQGQEQSGTQAGTYQDAEFERFLNKVEKLAPGFKAENASPGSGWIQYLAQQDPGSVQGGTYRDHAMVLAGNGDALGLAAMFKLYKQGQASQAQFFAKVEKLSPGFMAEDKDLKSNWYKFLILQDPSRKDGGTYMDTAVEFYDQESPSGIASLFDRYKLTYTPDKFAKALREWDEKDTKTAAKPELPTNEYAEFDAILAHNDAHTASPLKTAANDPTVLAGVLIVVALVGWVALVLVVRTKRRKTTTTGVSVGRVEAGSDKIQIGGKSIEREKAMSDFKFSCPKCNQPLEAPEDMCGQQIDCPACKQTMIIPRVGERQAPSRTGIVMNEESEQISASITAGKRMKLAMAIEYLAVIVAGVALLIDEKGIASFSTTFALASEVAVMIFGFQDKRPAGGDFFVYAFFGGWIAIATVASFSWSRSGFVWAMLLPVMGFLFNPIEKRTDDENKKTSANGWWIYAGFALLGAWLARNTSSWPTVMPLYAFAFIFARRGYIAGEENEKLAEAAKKREENEKSVRNLERWNRKQEQVDTDQKGTV